MHAADPLVSAADLATRLDAPGLRVLDASWYLPAMGRDARAEYLAGHLPGAVFADLDRLSDPHAPLPHMLPTPDRFAALAGALGVGDGDEVVVYDGSGAFLSAGRVWWMFRVFGHERVRVLDGGLAAWRAAGLPLAAGEVTPMPRAFRASFAPALVRDLAAVRAALDAGTAQVVDARPADRFEGRVAEPRAGVRAGHIPRSRNVPFTTVAAPDGTLLPADALRQRFAAAGLDLRRPIVCSCGSGTSAGALALALARLGRPDVAIYDGSWTEWGSAHDTPVATGPA